MVRAARVAGVLTLVLAVFSVVGCGGDTTGERSESAAYEWRTSTDEGTGKFYKGREIAPVRGHRVAEWMERPERAPSELPDRVVRAMDLRRSDVVADIGAGTGYFTFRISPEVPHGRVLAVDIQPEMLEIVHQRKRARGADNVETVLGTVTDPNLPARTVDVVLMVDSYHEFSHPHEMMQNIFEALAPGGRVILVEYRKEDPTLPVGELHRMSEEQARQEMEAVGLRWIQTKDILPQQHFMVFQKPVDEDAD